MERITFEDAEAKLLDSFRILIWLIPLIIFSEELMVFLSTNSFSKVDSSTIGILATLIWAIVLLKIVHVLEKIYTGEKELRLQKIQKSLQIDFSHNKNHDS